MLGRVLRLTATDKAIVLSDDQVMIDQVSAS
jgi:hypothetical protein